MKRISISLAALVASCAFSDSLPATCIDVDVGNYEDAHVTGGGSSTSNFGADTKLTIGMDTLTSTELDKAQKIYIRFDLTGVTPTGSPTLNLTLEGDSPAGVHEFNLWGLEDHLTNEDWDESTITWDNAPANDTNSYSGMLTTGSPRVHGGAVLSTSPFTIADTAAAGDLISIDVPLAFLTASTNNNLVTFMITPSTSTSLEFKNHNFHSGDAQTGDPSKIGPFLKVDGGFPAPEPSSLVLCGLAALCFGGYSAARRRFARPQGVKMTG